MELNEAETTSDIIYGGTDGLITTFSVMIACISSNQSNNTVIALSMANIFADGFAIGISSYQSEIVNPTEAVFKGIVTFLSFSLLGSIPVIVFYIYKDKDYFTKLCAIVVASLISLFVIGILKQYKINQKKSENNSLLRGGLKTAGLGACGGFIAYLVTKIITNFMKID